MQTWQSLLVNIVICALTGLLKFLVRHLPLFLCVFKLVKSSNLLSVEAQFSCIPSSWWLQGTNSCQKLLQFYVFWNLELGILTSGSMHEEGSAEAHLTRFLRPYLLAPQIVQILQLN